jgi:hypothetical protein
MNGSQDSTGNGSSVGRTVLLVGGLVLAFVIGFALMRILPFWLGLVLLIGFVVAARYYRIRTSGSGRS